MRINLLKCGFGRDAKNKIRKAHEKSTEGAIACLETFYYSFNNKDLDTFRSLLHLDSLIQLNNPLSGVVRGINVIEDLSPEIFEGPSLLWVNFSDIVCYCSDEIVVFVGTETGEILNDHETIPVKRRTTRVFAYAERDEHWCQLHHHGFMDDTDLLYQHQHAVSNKLQRSAVV